MTSQNRIYAFDDCSILHLCELEVPNGYEVFFSGKKNLHDDACPKLQELIGKLNHKNIPKYRFEPSNVEQNIIKTANQILEKQGQQVRMMSVLKAIFVEQAEEFRKKMLSEFELIAKAEDIAHVKKVFAENERQLKKHPNIPEDDDLKIIAGYIKQFTNDYKLLITEDEHFWGYSDLIQNHFKINVVKEWECNKISV